MVHGVVAGIGRAIGRSNSKGSGSKGSGSRKAHSSQVAAGTTHRWLHQLLVHRWLYQLLALCMTSSVCDGQECVHMGCTFQQFVGCMLLQLVGQSCQQLVQPPESCTNQSCCQHMSPTIGPMTWHQVGPSICAADHGPNLAAGHGANGRTHVLAATLIGAALWWLNQLPAVHNPQVAERHNPQVAESAANACDEANMHGVLAVHDGRYGLFPAHGGLEVTKKTFWSCISVRDFSCTRLLFWAYQNWKRSQLKPLTEMQLQKVLFVTSRPPCAASGPYRPPSTARTCVWRTFTLRTRSRCRGAVGNHFREEREG